MKHLALPRGPSPFPLMTRGMPPVSSKPIASASVLQSTEQAIGELAHPILDVFSGQATRNAVSHGVARLNQIRGARTASEARTFLPLKPMNPAMSCKVFRMAQLRTVEVPRL